VWLRLMLIALFANGLGPFGLRVLQDKGLLEPYRLPYLGFWYAGGLVLSGVVYLRRPMRMTRAEVLVGGAMACCSLGGQLATALALATVPGHITFAITTGGNLFIVAAAGILIFRERVGPYGLAGIALGIAALLLLES
jgi:multidrug transporter EmrE-like cation transporter